MYHWIVSHCVKNFEPKTYYTSYFFSAAAHWIHLCNFEKKKKNGIEFLHPWDAFWCILQCQKISRPENFANFANDPSIREIKWSWNFLTLKVVNSVANKFGNRPKKDTFYSACFRLTVWTNSQVSKAEIKFFYDTNHKIDKKWDCSREFMTHIPRKPNPL